MHPSSPRPADTLHVVHFTPHRPLLLTNSWDAASARLIEHAGATAIATTSAGVAWSLGRPDGNTLTRGESLAAARRIITAVSIPVTLDLEGGYGATPAEVAGTVSAAIDIGAAGINLEDGTLDPAAFADRIRAARSAAKHAGVRLFINARTDVFLNGMIAPPARVAETITRAQRYLAAGADGVFVPGLTDEADTRDVVCAVPAPVNVMVCPDSPRVSTLAALGVARISLGSGAAHAAYGIAERAARESFESGTSRSTRDAANYSTLNALFSA